jgi:hypothetical protein
VPVDCAAKVLIQLLEDPDRVKEPILAVLRPDSIQLGDFYNRLNQHLKLPKSSPIWRQMPDVVKKAMDKAHLVPADLYDYLVPPALAKNPAFSRHFPKAIPHFDDYEAEFFAGFTRFLESMDI